MTKIILTFLFLITVAKQNEFETDIFWNLLE